MAKILRGLIPKKVLKEIETEAEKVDKKRSAFFRILLRLAASNPGRAAKQSDELGKPKPVRLQLKRADFAQLKPYMEKHNLDRGNVLGPALARGWELYTR